MMQTMNAYQPQPQMGQPGMPHGHPGMQTPQQHMSMAQQMQPGVSGPGAPHVSQAQAMMGGMQPSAMASGGMGGQQPGGGVPGQIMAMGGQSMAGQMPNAHAMSHLTPQAQLAHQQQQQQLAQHPQYAMQMHQQRLIQQRQHMAQAQANGMLGGMQQAGQMQGMTPQIIQQLQQNQQNFQNNSGVQLPSHVVQQQMQVRQQPQQVHPNQAQAMAQQMAMQQANSQHSNQGQPGPPQPQGQPGHPAQMRPQSRMANPHDQSQTPVLQQQQPQQPQGQAPQPGPQQPQQGQPVQLTPQQVQALQQRHRQIAMMQQQQQRQTQLQQAAQAQAQQQQVRGQFILRLMLFADQLGSYNLQTGKDMAQWQNFVDRHFAPEGHLLHELAEGNEKPRQYEILRGALPRYFWMYFETGAHSLRLHTENAQEAPLPENRHRVSCSKATLTAGYPNGSRVEMNGSLNVLFASGSQSVERMEFRMSSCEETMSRTEVEKVLSSWSPTFQTKSLKLAKNKLPKAQQKLQGQQQNDTITIEHLPKAPRSQSGLTLRMKQFLEIGETLGVMQDLMFYAQDNKLRPDAALEAIAHQAAREGGQHQQQPGQGNPYINIPPNGIPYSHQGGTPRIQHQAMPVGPQHQFSSPAVSHLNLPMQNGIANGSPHLGHQFGPQGMPQNATHSPSPAQQQCQGPGHMQAPAMMPQHSQQGTNSSAASANTSPNVSSKRRRSTVKVEGDEGGGAGPSDQQQQANAAARGGRPIKVGKKGRGG